MLVKDKEHIFTKWWQRLWWRYELHRRQIQTEITTGSRGPCRGKERQRAPPVLEAELRGARGEARSGKSHLPNLDSSLILYHGPPVMEDGGPVGLPTLNYLHWDDDLGPVGLSTRKYQVIIHEANLFLFRERRWKPFVFRKESALTGSGRDCTHCWDLDKGPANKSGGAGHIYHVYHSGRF